MESKAWHDEQLDSANSLLGQGSQMLRRNQFDSAEQVLTEASAVLDMVEQPDLRFKKLRAQLWNELGFVRQRQDRLDDALNFHKLAVDACESLVEEGEDFLANATATHINLAGVVSQKGDHVRAKALSARAVELAEQVLEKDELGESDINLVFGAHQNRAIISAKSEDLKSADEAMERALDVLEKADEDLRKRAAVQVAQGAQQISVLMFNDGDHKRALRWGEVAESHSEIAFEVIGQQVLPVYVTSQINLIYFHEKAGAYARAEDALFKALDVVGDNEEILTRGKQFYEECRKQADRRLEEGNLPRAEVEEGYAEILERLEAVQASGASTDS